MHIETDESLEHTRDVREMMTVACSLLKEKGIPEQMIRTDIRKKKEGVARDILREIAEGGYGTVVVGRRGISRTQQFLFGSVSNKIVHNARGCTVMVVD
jgi:nucleotide-binding universal stress UspA family protein